MVGGMSIYLSFPLHFSALLLSRNVVRLLFACLLLSRCASRGLFVLTVWRAVRCHLIGARDLIIDSAPILAWRRTDPDAASGHAPAHHPRPLLHGYRVHTLLCRGSGLPVHFLLSPAGLP